MGKIIGLVVSWAIAAIVFWLAFFVLAPAIANAIPESDWKQILVFLDYGIVAYLGGIGFPLMIGIMGTVFSLKLFD